MWRFAFHRASTKQQASSGRLTAAEVNETKYLSYHSSFTAKFAEYELKHLAVTGLTMMIKTIAQMRNVRRGHDAQSRLKKIRIDKSAEGYVNFVAPKRVERIAHDALEKGHKEGDKIYNDHVLKLASDTCLTPEWDEMVPFPMTWKIRFDGFGPSNYGPRYKYLQLFKLPDDFPPFYQPSGPSHTGDTFADTVCICNTPGRECLCKGEEINAKTLQSDLEPMGTKGCGVPGGY